MAQHVAHGEEARLVVFDDTAVGREVYLAVGEGVERVDSLVARNVDDVGKTVEAYLWQSCGFVVRYHLAYHGGVVQDARFLTLTQHLI